MFDPITLQDSRDDIAAYRDDGWNSPTNPDSNVAAVVENELRALTTYGCLLTAEPGEIDDIRAPHVWSVGRETVDHTPEQYRPMDSYRESVTAVKKVKRGKKGTSVTVTRHGRSLVGGETGRISDTGRVPASVIRHAIDSTRDRSATGLADGVALARIATLLYDIPELIGGDVKSWSEVIPETDENGRPMDPRDISAHLNHPVGLSGGVSPMLDRLVGPEYRTADVDRDHETAIGRIVIGDAITDEWSISIHRPNHYPRAWTTGETAVDWPTRYVHGAKRRAGETARETVIRTDQNDRGTLWSHVTELWSGGDNGRMFIGHTAHDRPPTVREIAAANAKVSDGDIDIAPDEVIADVLAGEAAERLNAGLSGRWTWTQTTAAGLLRTGTLTISKSRLVSVNGAGLRVASARTVAGLRSILARQSVSLA